MEAQRIGLAASHYLGMELQNENRSLETGIEGRYLPKRVAIRDSSVEMNYAPLKQSNQVISSQPSNALMTFLCSIKATQIEERLICFLYAPLASKDLSIKTLPNFTLLEGFQ